jgi:hypothetical protein
MTRGRDRTRPVDPAPEGAAASHQGRFALRATRRIQAVVVVSLVAAVLAAASLLAPGPVADMVRDHDASPPRSSAVSCERVETRPGGSPTCAASPDGPPHEEPSAEEPSRDPARTEAEDREELLRWVVFALTGTLHALGSRLDE